MSRGRARTAIAVASTAAALIATVVSIRALAPGEGIFVVLLLVLPPLIALGATLVRDRAAIGAAAGVLGFWSLFSLASVGMLHLPATLLMAIAAMLPEGAGGATALRNASERPGATPRM